MAKAKPSVLDIARQVSDKSSSRRMKCTVCRTPEAREGFREILEVMANGNDPHITEHFTHTDMMAVMEAIGCKVTKHMVRNHSSEHEPELWKKIQERRSSRRA